MKLRKIKVKALGVSGLIYGLHIILIQSIFFWFITGNWEWAVGTSVAWNILNTLLYYNYHYWFARLFKLGKDEKAMILWLTGNSGAGKTTTAQNLKKKRNCIILDGDKMRESISLGLGFSKEDREENNLRIARLAKILREEGHLVVISVIAPFRSTREKITKIIPEVKWVYVKRDLPILKEKPYEKPDNPDLVININKNNKRKCVEILDNFINKLERKKV